MNHQYNLIKRGTNYMESKVLIKPVKGKMCDQACCINCWWFTDRDPSRYDDRWYVKGFCERHGTSDWYRGDQCCGDWDPC